MSIKILLADDSITIQKVVGIIFGGEEYALTVVDNGKAAIEKAKELSPDVLLIDALMPGISGYEVCEAVRATPALATKPILILTGSFEPFDEDKAKGCGADDFLSKPFESQQIVTKVKELYELGLQRAVAPLQTAPVAEAAPTPEMGHTFAPTAPIEPPVAAKPVFEEPADDIWGAFTANEVPAATAAPAVAAFETELPTFEPDVFSIISEEPEVEITQPVETPISTGTQWVPVDEHTFEFSEEVVAQIPPSALPEQGIPAEEMSFGEISFDEPAQPAFSQPPVEAAAAVFEPAPAFIETVIPAYTETPEPVFEAPAESVFAEQAPVLEVPGVPDLELPVSPPPEIPSFETSPAEPVQQPVQPAAAVLTEEQLRAAIAGVSQEVIQRIVWEVVPDLAETLIKEAIRKIKAGL